MSYVYIRSEPSLWTVGFYNPSGKWVAESDHDSTEEAARRVHMLNGGTDSRLLVAIEALFPADDWSRYDPAVLSEKLTVNLICTRAEIVALREAIRAAKKGGAA